MVMPGTVDFHIDTRSYERFRKRVERWQGKPLLERMDRGTLEAARFLVRPIRREAPTRSGDGNGARPGKRGDLKRSVKARRGRATAGFQGQTSGAYVGPTDYKRHWVIQGTGGHSLSPRPGRGRLSLPAPGEPRVAAALTHPGSKANPFVDRAAQASADEALRTVISALEED